jgi:hypothetical protein
MMTCRTYENRVCERYLTALPAMNLLVHVPAIFSN